jgi:hypothetical protein
MAPVAALRAALTRISADAAELLSEATMTKLVKTLAAAHALLIALAFLPSSPVGGQTQPSVPTARTVNLTVEQRHVIKEIVKDLKIQDAGEVQVSVGEVVPNSVKLHPMSDDITRKVPQVKSHVFFVKDDRIVLVNPTDNKIADVID